MTGRPHPLDVAFLAAMEGYPPTTRWEMAFQYTVLGPVPTAAELRRRAEELVARLPFLALRLHGPAGARRWAPDPFDAAEQVAVVEAVDADHQQALARTWLDEPLDVPGPAWRLRIVHTPGAAGFTVVHTVHHALQDGLAAARTGLALLGCTPRPAPVRPRPAARRHAADLVRLAARTAADVTRGLAYRPGPFPFLTGRPGPMRVVDLPLARLKAIGARSGGTANDVFLGAVGTAVAHWATACGLDLAELPVLVPLDARHPTEQTWHGLQHGNRLFSTRLLLPGQGVSPAERLARVIRALHHRTVTARHAVQDTVRYLPASVARTAVRLFSAPGYSAAIVSSCPLPAHTPPDGLRVVSFLARGPLTPGHLLAVVLSGDGEQARICFHPDAGLPCPEALVDGWWRALAELETALLEGSGAVAGPGGVRPGRPRPRRGRSGSG
ncbi:hypothetical protein ABTZ03_00035 [Kitasatospora sp. NPDC096077]|uniref:hypothetical protein n=1 Tax=Kitasatospora sp. NPDC096077 TaxID=3155544 RepID=UPI003327873F